MKINLLAIILLLTGCGSMTPTPVSEYVSMVCDRSIFEDQEDMTAFIARSTATTVKVMNCNQKPVYRLYNEALRRDSSLEGIINLNFKVAPNGDVIKVTIISSEMGDKIFEDRLSELLTAFKFPKADTDTVNVQFPLDFAIMY